jgi:Ribonuclease HII
MLAREKREKIYKELQKICPEILVSKIQPKEINEAMSKGISLNDLEAYHFAKLIVQLKSADKVYLDSPDVIQERFGIRVKELCSKPVYVGNRRSRDYIEAIKVISEHKADAKYPVVSAASIIAKTVRDKDIRILERKLRFKIGSGYPSDSRTIEAIRKNLRNVTFSEHLRSRWSTMDRIRQSSLLSFASAND